MAPPPSNPRHCTRQVRIMVLLLLSSIATTLAAAVPSSYSSHCSSPPPAPDLPIDVGEDIELVSSFHLSTGFFSGSGADSLFYPDNGGGLHHPSFNINLNDRFFSFIPDGVSRTTDPALIHLTATLTLFGYRVETYEYNGDTMRLDHSAHSISFHLDGYYSSTSAELCMVGAGTDTEHAAAVAGSVKHYADVALRLRVPSPPSLTDTFVTGRLEGADFEAVSLVTYAEGDVYKYSGRASCPPTPMEPEATAGCALMPPQAQAQHSGFSCSALRARLITTYRLEYGSRHASSTSSGSSLPWLREPRMNVNQVRCAANGAVRVYAVFSNDTSRWTTPMDRFSVEEQAVVADGFWDSATSRLCLSACRVVRSASGPSATENLEVRECGIGMSFWFPAVWTVRDRSVAAGLLWNASANSHAGVISSPITASSFTKVIRGNLSDVAYEYNHTMLETAKQHYLKATLSNDKKSKDSFPSNHTYSYRDFEFRFFLDDQSGGGGGRAYPVSIGQAMVVGDKLAAEYSFSQHAAPEMEQSRLVNVSYFILVSVSFRKLKAEGVYDTKTCFLSMVICEERNGSTDCQILMTVQFTSFDEPQGFGHGKGRISSLRDSTDHLYFEPRDITLLGVYIQAGFREEGRRCDCRGPNR